MKRLLVAIALVAVICLLAVGFLYRSRPAPAPPDAEKAPPKDVVAYLASDDFAKLPEAKRSEYFEALMKLPPERRAEGLKMMEGLTDAQQEKVMKNVGSIFHSRLAKEAAEYRALKPGEREAYLDRKIDEMERQRKEMTAARASDDGKGPEEKGPPWMKNMNPDRMQRFMQKMLSDTTPEERAYISEYMMRMMARGIQHMGGGQ
jgi:hypothetical protein